MRRCMFIDWDALVQLLDPIISEPVDEVALAMMDRIVDSMVLA